MYLVVEMKNVVKLSDRLTNNLEGPVASLILKCIMNLNVN